MWVPTKVKVTDVVTLLTDHLWQHVGETGVLERSFGGEFSHPYQLEEVSLQFGDLYRNVAVQR